MKLSYRGIGYEYNPASPEVADSPLTGKYRGQPIHFHNLKRAIAHGPEFDLKYRGVSYHTH
ncbi:MAG: DUF4278 domain-containing protein [Cyanothece sp. SIO1E1]|nr:DUF4278 domain-containing protein [Cyanothece sp. SIO1E1]